MNSPEREGFQNSKEPFYGKMNRLVSPAQNQGTKVNRIMIQIGTKKGWFYPSKGVNELFYWAGKIAIADLRGALSTHPNPKPTPPNASPGNSQRRCRYIEVLTMVTVEGGRTLGGARMGAKVMQLMTRKRVPWQGGLRKEAAALRGERSIMLDATIRATKEAEHMADMRGDGRGIHIEDIDTLDLGSMAVLDEAVVIKWLVRVPLMELDLTQYTTPSDSRDGEPTS
jgi:hypothetical protein